MRFEGAEEEGLSCLVVLSSRLVKRGIGAVSQRRRGTGSRYEYETNPLLPAWSDFSMGNFGPTFSCCSLVGHHVRRRIKLTFLYARPDSGIGGGFFFVCGRWDWVSLIHPTVVSSGILEIGWAWA